MATLKDRFAAEIDGLADLPSISPIVTQLLATLGRPDAGVAEIGDIIRQEPVLAGKVLQAANSSFYARRSPAASIRDALLRLGLATVRRLAMVMSLCSLPVKGMKLGMQQFWLHSLSVAHAVDVLGRHSQNVPEDADGEIIFLAGLMHDVGLLVLASHYGPEYEAASKLAQQRAIGFVDAERAVFGADHGELGAILAASWKLPKEISEPMAGHHQPDTLTATSSWVAHLLQLADSICSGAMLGDLRETVIDAGSWEAAGIPLEVTQKVIAEIHAQSESVTSLLAALKPPRVS